MHLINVALKDLTPLFADTIIRVKSHYKRVPVERCVMQNALFQDPISLIAVVIPVPSVLPLVTPLEGETNLLIQTVLKHQERRGQFGLSAALKNKLVFANSKIHNQVATVQDYHQAVQKCLDGERETKS